MISVSLNFIGGARGETRGDPSTPRQTHFDKKEGIQKKEGFQPSPKETTYRFDLKISIPTEEKSRNFSNKISIKTLVTACGLK